MSSIILQTVLDRLLRQLVSACYDDISDQEAPMYGVVRYWYRG